MTTLAALIEQHRQNPSLDTQTAIAKHWADANKEQRAQMKSALLNYIISDIHNAEENETNQQRKGISWHWHFEGHQEMWDAIYLEELRMRFITDHNWVELSKTHNVDHDIVYDLANSCFRSLRHDLPRLVDQARAIWNEVFSDVENASAILDEHIAKKEEELNAYLAQFKQKDSTKENNTTPVESSAISVEIPMLAKETNSNRKPSHQMMCELMDESTTANRLENIAKDLNQFNLQSYIEMPECQAITLKFEGPIAIFRATFSEQMSKKLSEQFCEALSGQLSDGWGEGIEQEPLPLDQGGEAYISFDWKQKHWKIA